MSRHRKKEMDKMGLTLANNSISTPLIQVMHSTGGPRSEPTEHRSVQVDCRFKERRCDTLEFAFIAHFKMLSSDRIQPLAESWDESWWIFADSQYFSTHLIGWQPIYAPFFPHLMTKKINCLIQCSGSDILCFLYIQSAVDWLFVSVISLEKMSNICWFHPLNCEVWLLFFVIYSK